MTAMQTQSSNQPLQPLDEPLAVVSCDGHIGPRLVEDLRPYCPQKYLQAFDEYVERLRSEQLEQSARTLLGESDSEDAARLMKMFDDMMAIDGHHDMHARLADMDHDGVTAEVIFPSSHNGQSEPFIQSDLFLDPLRGDTELFAVGMRIYAEWLADAVKVSPQRFIGLVTPPLWDIDASITTVKWAAQAGLKGVFLLMPRPGFKRYDHPDWEPFWAVCEDLGLTLNAHSGAPLEDAVHGPHEFCMHEIETAGWPARKAVHQMIFSGVFERHPKLKLILTEQNFDWWVSSRREFDSSFAMHRGQLKHLSRKPSEYMASNVYIGGSFLAPFEAADAVQHAYTGNVMWGRDYGHIEGTFVPTVDIDPATNPSRLSLRHAFSNIPAAAIQQMASDNALEVYQLDRAELTRVAKSIGAPSLKELMTPIHAIPSNGGALAFRQIGAWA
ncbi:MAG: amidohydrolase 2 [Verrucomicrobiaceae bacterium]|nr:amidohydrolase 2 [Verrucomicrobiaceae bacterium]